MRKIIGIMCGLLIALTAYGQKGLIEHLRSGQAQHIVVYGTSLSSGACGNAWMRPVAAELNKRYGDSLVTYTLAGKGGMWSTWGVTHLEDSVIAKKPDAVIIEFGINDAFRDYQTSVAVARLNLEYMIDRIRLSVQDCEIFLQVMNMPIGKSAGFRPHLADYYAMYRETAQKKGVTLIDHYANWERVLEQGEAIFRTYVPDGIHPNTKGGEQIIAPHILKRILPTTSL
ncbi:SGNH/GDSL hydrolase family protein [Sphingobacterium sp. SYP-B4668]|uniref:SGNH/GDSL hydrolase family protein n=1 Tax=Sphingobacterium sp. SYP-B4668 TaxID=2996035 RepID=UPI0022DD4810|nr:SGNH/GDSL hydrolase family protein [Sphingobacterium sp. SYP-B4668]